jgi:hypothetical protein
MMIVPLLVAVQDDPVDPEVVENEKSGLLFRSPPSRYPEIWSERRHDAIDGMAVRG